MISIFKSAIVILALLFLSTNVYAENTVTSTVTGTTTVDRTPPTASAPNVMINNQDVCSTGTSAAIQTQIFGIAGGTTIRDLNCERNSIKAEIVDQFSEGFKEIKINYKKINYGRN